MSVTPVVTVGAFFINDEHKVLMGLRAAWKSAWPGHWDTIGGHVEAGETLEAALVREAWEEVGVTPTEFTLLASVEERRPELYGSAIHHVFKVSAWEGGSLVNKCDEHTELRWFDVAEMQALSNLVDCDYPALAKRAAS
ncbi:NUDIX hydrolase [Mesorhizobium sp. NPDC059054]|uniref:NUDIX hydrolase n=1 Tax=Mesorhizobium sp. NPDC059054 TaxID=3346711 RepID=UPI00369E03A5